MSMISSDRPEGIFSCRASAGNMPVKTIGSCSLPKVRKAHVTMLLIMSTLFLGLYFSSSLIMMIFLILSASVVFISPMIGLCIYMVLATCGNFFTFGIPGTSLSRFFGLLYIVSALLRMVNRRLHMRLGLFLGVIILTTINLCSLTYSLSLEGSWNTFLTMALNMAVFLVTATYHFNEKEFTTVAALYAEATLVFFMVYVSLRHGFSALLVGERVSLAAGVNPNVFAKSLAQLAFFPLFGLLTSGRSIRRFVLAGLLLCGSFGTLLAAGSRSSVFGFILGLALVLLFAGGDVAAWRRAMVLASVVAMLSLVLIVLGKVGEPIANRYSLAAIIQGDGTRRFVIWRFLIEDVIPSHLWFGTGLGGQTVVEALESVSAPLIYQMPAHNMVLDLLTQLGLVGLIAYGLLFFSTFVRAIHAVRKSSPVLPFAAMFIASLAIGVGESMFVDKILWISAAMCWRDGNDNMVERLPRVGGGNPQT